MQHPASLPWLISLIVLASCTGGTPPRPPAAAPDGVVWRLDPAAVAALPLPAGAAWVPEGPDRAICLRVSVAPADAASGHVLRIPLDLTPWRGLKLAVVGSAAAEGVTRPPRNRWNGVKCTLYYNSPSSGEHWVQARDCHGSFPWSEVGSITAIAGDAGPAELRLGLEESSGTVRFADVRLLAIATPAVRPAAAPAPADRPQPLRGTMVGGEDKEASAADLDTLASWGATLLRLPLTRHWAKVGTDRDQAEYDRWIDGQIEEVQRTLDLASGRGLKVAIDLHAPPGGRLPDNTMAMLVERPYQEQFIRTWERIARRFHGHPALWGYDLLNEPVQNRPSPPGCLDWLGVQVAAARAIRAIDPRTPVIIAPDFGGEVPGFTYLTPVPLDNVFYTVHMYWPLAYTHQGVYDRTDYLAGTVKPIAYPGTRAGQPFDREALRRHLQPVRDFQLAHGVRIYVGEFSAIRWAPGADRYLEDCTAIFAEYGWDWTYHAFREWDAWSVEHQDLPIEPIQRATTPTRRLQVLQQAFRTTP